jgi:hypothetical protein
MVGMGFADERIVRLPFPLTIKFKSMLQAGVATRDMDPQWMSSISWYVLCIFGLQSVFNYLLGSDNGKSSVFPYFSYRVLMIFSCQPNGTTDGPDGPRSWSTNVWTGC